MSKKYYTFVDIAVENGLTAVQLCDMLEDWQIIRRGKKGCKLLPEYKGLGYEIELNDTVTEHFTEAGRAFINGMVRG